MDRLLLCRKLTMVYFGVDTYFPLPLPLPATLSPISIEMLVLMHYHGANRSTSVLFIKD